MLARILKASTLISIYVTLIACGRQDEPIVPGEFPPVVEPFCLEGNPYETFQITNGVRVGDTAYSFDYDRFEYEMGVNHYTDSLEFELSSFGRVFVPNVLTTLSELQTGNSKPLLSEAQLARLTGADITLNVLTAELLFELNGDAQVFTSDTEVLKQEVPLSVGINNITVKYNATIDIPYSGAECDLAAGTSDEDLETLTRGISVVYEYNFSITRESREDLKISEPEHTTDILGESATSRRNIVISGNTLILGVPMEDSGSDGVFSESELRADTSSTIINELAQDSGAVFIYTRDDRESDWSLSSFIKAPNSDAGDMFGYSVSLQDDILAISAPGEDSSSSQIYYEGSSPELLNAQNNNLSSNSGAVYLFERTEDSWNEVAYIKPHFNLPAVDGYNNGFGNKLVLSNNYLLIGAPKEDSLNGEFGGVDKPNSGAVYVYHVPQTQSFTDNLLYSGVVKAFGVGEGDGFGSNLSFDGSKLYVAAPYEDSSSQLVLQPINDGSAGLDESDPRLDNSAIDSGAVYVFQTESEGNGRLSFEPLSFIKASNAGAGDRFGFDLVSSGDQLAISAPYEDGAGIGFNREMGSNSLTDSGATYVFSLNIENNKFFESIYIKPLESAQNSLFGSALAFKGNNLVVGHPYYDPFGVVDAGEFLVYTRNALTSDWSYQDKVHNDVGGNQLAGDQLGGSVAMDGDTIAATTKSNNYPIVLTQ